MPDPFTDLLAGLGVPIIAAPMGGGPSTPELVVAVGGAGGLGFLAAGYLTAGAMRAEIARTREGGDRPFGVNVFVGGPRQISDAALSEYTAELAPEAAALGVELGGAVHDDDDFDAKVDALVADPVAVVSFTFGLPDASVIAGLRDRGTLVVATVTTGAEAAAAAAIGVDALCVQGSEAGGHQGRFVDRIDAPAPLHLRDALAEAAAVTTLPLIAAGGIATAEDVGAVLGAGAVAAQVGTAFLRCPEAGTVAAHRDALVDARFGETALTRAFTGRLARGLRNRFMDDHCDAPVGYPEIHHLTRPLRRAAARQGVADALHLWAGVGHRHAGDDPAAAVLARLTP